MAGVTNLPAHFLEFFHMAICHIFRMRQIVTSAIVAEGLSMAVIASLLVRVRDVPVLDRPAEIFVSFRNVAYDHRRFHDHLIAASNDRHGMAKITLHADRFLYAAFIGGNVISVVAAETSQSWFMPFVIRVGFPVQSHVGKVRGGIKFLERLDRLSHIFLGRRCVTF